MVERDSVDKAEKIAWELTKNKDYDDAVKRRQAMVVGIAPDDVVGTLFHGGNISELTLALGTDKKSDKAFESAVSIMLADRHASVSEVIEIIQKESSKAKK